MKLNAMLTCINPTLRRLYHKLLTQFLVILSFENRIKYVLFVQEIDIFKGQWKTLNFLWRKTNFK